MTTRRIRYGFFRKYVRTGAQPKCSLSSRPRTTRTGTESSLNWNLIEIRRNEELKFNWNLIFFCFEICKKFAKKSHFFFRFLWAKKYTIFRSYSYILRKHIFCHFFENENTTKNFNFRETRIQISIPDFNHFSIRIFGGVARSSVRNFNSGFGSCIRVRLQLATR